jgi:hypothetical protein
MAKDTLAQRKRIPSKGFPKKIRSLHLVTLDQRYLFHFNGLSSWIGRCIAEII